MHRVQCIRPVYDTIPFTVLIIRQKMPVVSKYKTEVVQSLGHSVLCCRDLTQSHFEVKVAADLSRVEPSRHSNSG